MKANKVIVIMNIVLMHNLIIIANDDNQLWDKIYNNQKKDKPQTTSRIVTDVPIVKSATKDLLEDAVISSIILFYNSNNYASDRFFDLDQSVFIKLKKIINRKKLQEKKELLILSNYSTYIQNLTNITLAAYNEDKSKGTKLASFFYKDKHKSEEKVHLFFKKRFFYSELKKIESKEIFKILVDNNIPFYYSSKKISGIGLGYIKFKDILYLIIANNLKVDVVQKSYSNLITGNGEWEKKAKSFLMNDERFKSFEIDRSFQLSQQKPKWIEFVNLKDDIAYKAYYITLPHPSAKDIEQFIKTIVKQED